MEVSTSTHMQFREGERESVARYRTFRPIFQQFVFIRGNKLIFSMSKQKPENYMKTCIPAEIEKIAKNPLLKLPKPLENSNWIGILVFGAFSCIRSLKSYMIFWFRCSCCMKRTKIRYHLNLFSIDAIKLNWSGMDGIWWCL